MYKLTNEDLEFLRLEKREIISTIEYLVDKAETIRTEINKLQSETEIKKAKLKALEAEISYENFLLLSVVNTIRLETR